MGLTQSESICWSARDLRPRLRAAEHRTDKWVPLFGRNRCASKHIARRSDSIETSGALDSVNGGRTPRVEKKIANLLAVEAEDAQAAGNRLESLWPRPRFPVLRGSRMLHPINAS